MVVSQQVGAGNLTLGPLEEQSVFLISEPSLQPLGWKFKAAILTLMTTSSL